MYNMSLICRSCCSVRIDVTSSSRDFDDTPAIEGHQPSSFRSCRDPSFLPNTGSGQLALRNVHKSARRSRVDLWTVAGRLPDLVWEAL